MLRFSEIYFDGHEHGELRPDTLYAEVVDESGRIAISATLDFVLRRVRDGLIIQGCHLETYKRSGVECTRVYLDIANQ